MHTDETLQIMEDITASLGRELCAFSVDTCLAFPTHELRCEAECRRHQQQQSMATSKATVSCQSKTFNLQTNKLHALRDYVSSIMRFGTTNSYSTQPMRDSTLVGVAFLLFAHRENESTASGKGGSFGPVARISFVSSLKLKGGSYAYAVFARGWMLHTKPCWNLFPTTRRNTIRSEDRKICLSISQFLLDRILTTQLSG
jgi:hypothetical protein